jgi:hypothetical protein
MHVGFGRDDLNAADPPGGSQLRPQIGEEIADPVVPIPSMPHDLLPILQSSCPAG